MVADAVGDSSQRAKATRPGRRFARMETRADHGRHTIGADEDITDSGSAIRERERDPAVCHGEADSFATSTRAVCMGR